MNNINLCFPTISEYGKLANAINSSCQGSLKPTQINIIDNGGKFKENFGEISEVDGVPLKVFVPKKNYGVSKSWNYFLHSLDDHIIISNDDVVFDKNTIKLLVEAAENNPSSLFFCPDIYWEHYWSMYLQRKESLAIVGEYDGNMPIYFSDRDYLHRMKVAGYKPFIVKDCTYEHVDGGATSLKSKDEEVMKATNSFGATEQYYRIKWRGICGLEKNEKPFGIS